MQTSKKVSTVDFAKDLFGPLKEDSNYLCNDILKLR